MKERGEKENKQSLLEVVGLCLGPSPLCATPAERVRWKGRSTDGDMEYAFPLRVVYVTCPDVCRYREEENAKTQPPRSCMT